MSVIVYRQDPQGHTISGPVAFWVHGGMGTSLLQVLLLLLSFGVFGVFAVGHPPTPTLLSLGFGVLFASTAQYYELGHRRRSYPTLLSSTDPRAGDDVDTPTRESHLIGRLQDARGPLGWLLGLNALLWLVSVSAWITHSLGIYQSSSSGVTVDAMGIGMMALSVIALMQVFQLWRRIRRLASLCDARHSISIQPERIPS